MAIHDDAGQLIVHQSNPLADLAAAFMKLMAPPVSKGAATVGAPGSNGRSDVIVYDMGDAAALDAALDGMHLPSGAAAAGGANGELHAASLRQRGGNAPVIQEPGALAAAGRTAGGAASLAMPAIPPAGTAGIGSSGAAPAADLFAAGGTPLIIGSVPVTAAGEAPQRPPAAAGAAAAPLPEVPSLHNFVPLPGTSLAGQQPSSSGTASGPALSDGNGALAGLSAGSGGPGYPGLTITEVTSPVIDMPDLDGLDLGLDDPTLDIMPSQVCTVV